MNMKRVWKCRECNVIDDILLDLNAYTEYNKCVVLYCDYATKSMPFHHRTPLTNKGIGVTTENA